MRHVAQLAEQVRQQRRPASPDNPLVQMQAMVSEGIIAALDGWRDLRDRSLEQMFLAIYSTPLLQALVGLSASDERPRRRPGIEPERIAFIQRTDRRTQGTDCRRRDARSGPPQPALHRHGGNGGG